MQLHCAYIQLNKLGNISFVVIVFVRCEETKASGWIHVSSREHYCRACYEHFTLLHTVAASRFSGWAQDWVNKSRAREASLKLHIIDQVLYCQFNSYLSW